MTQGGSRLILGSKGQGWISTSNFLQFLHGNSFSYWPSVMKGQGQIWTPNSLQFLQDNSFPYWLTMMILHTCADHDPGRTSIDFGVKRPKVKVKCLLQTFNSFRRITPFHFDLQWWYFTHVLTMTNGGPLLILGSKGQRSRSNSDFKLFTISAWKTISFWHTMMILYVCVDYDRKMTSIAFGVHMSIMVKVRFCVWSMHCLCTLTLLLFDLQYWYSTHVFPETSGLLLLILGSIG